MYAVIETGGKQYKIQPGDFLQIEKLEGEVGNAIQFDQVLFMGQAGSSEITLGKPFISGALVQGQIVGQGRGDKILIIKMKRRKQYRRTQGHRQEYTQVLITGVSAGEQKLDLNETEKAEKLKQFQSHLKPKGQAFTAPTLGSRERAKRAAAATAAQQQ